MEERLQAIDTMGRSRPTACIIAPAAVAPGFSSFLTPPRAEETFNTQTRAAGKTWYDEVAFMQSEALSGCAQDSLPGTQSYRGGAHLVAMVFPLTLHECTLFINILLIQKDKMNPMDTIIVKFECILCSENVVTSRMPQALSL